jgi:hypothetical protein
MSGMKYEGLLGCNRFFVLYQNILTLILMQIHCLYEDCSESNLCYFRQLMWEKAALEN